jgi:hypothetical protein
LARLEAKYESPIERRFFLLDSNYEKVLICLIMKATGNIMPGVDIKACVLFKEWYDDVRREYELSRAKGSRTVSKKQQGWIERSLAGTNVTPVSDKPAASVDGPDNPAD